MISVIDEIARWSTRQPRWQQHALALLHEHGQLTTEDDDWLYALLRTSDGTAPAKTSFVPQAGREAAPVGAVRLLAISRVRGVNALADDQRLELSPHGLTIIYGANGSGKSGYGRLLKRACRARDQRETILPDARLAPGVAPAPAASFELLVEREPLRHEWTETAASAHLRAITVFDAHCGAGYLEGQGDFSYAPFGLDLLDGLSAACGRLAARLERDRQASTPNTAPLEELAKSQTAVGAALATLSRLTSVEEIGQLATLSDAEKISLETIERTLEAGDLVPRAKLLRSVEIRLRALAAKCAELASSVSDAAIADLRGLVEASLAARRVAETAGEALRAGGDVLPGTGGPAWVELIHAARAFVAESHAGHDLSTLPDEAACPLCQQPLGVARARLVVFDQFLRAAAESNWKKARELARASMLALRDLRLAVALDPEVEEHLQANDPDVLQTTIAFLASLPARRDSAVAACLDKDARAWNSVPPAEASCAPALLAAAERLRVEALALDAAASADERTAAEKRRAELVARLRLASLMPNVTEALQKMALQHELKEQSKLVQTAPITKKASELVEKLVAAGVEAAFDDELSALGVSELRVRLRRIGQKGKTQFKLTLAMPGEEGPHRVLSEGEQRAVALAALFAELRLSGTGSAVVFDDPVSSLDHRRRAIVAARIAREASVRQVVVLTHDLAFLSELQRAAIDAGAAVQALSLTRTAAGFGVPSTHIPFDATPA